MSVYCTRQDLVDRFGEADIAQLEAGRPGAIAEAIADAGALIDSFLAIRYDLPLALDEQGQVPAVLNTLSRDLVRYALEHQPGDAVKKRRDDAMKYLDALAKGHATLGLPEAVEPTGEDLADWASSPSVFSREHRR